MIHRTRRRLGSRGGRALLATLLPLTALLVGLTTAAPASAGTSIYGFAAIYGLNSMCMDDRADGVTGANPVQVYGCHNGTNQAWMYFQNNGNDIESALYGHEGQDMCLDINGGGTANGTPVDLWPCNGQPNQEWVWMQGNSLYNPASAKCLDDPNDGGPGTQLDIWTCNGYANQIWNITGFAPGGSP